MAGARQLIFGVLLGIIAGFLFGRLALPSLLAPPQLQDLSPQARQEIVLMIAEIHQARGDLAATQRWLRQLGDDPAQTVQAVLQSAQKGEASQYPLQALEALYSALTAAEPVDKASP